MQFFYIIDTYYIFYEFGQIVLKLKQEQLKDDARCFSWLISTWAQQRETEAGADHLALSLLCTNIYRLYFPFGVISIRMSNNNMDLHWITVSLIVLFYIQ